MKNIFSFFQGVFTLFKSISKSMYRRCAIIASGSAVIAVVCLNSTCYGGGGKNNVTTAYAGVGQASESEDEEADDAGEESMLLASIEPLMADVTGIGLSERREDIEAAKNTEEEVLLVNADYITPIISITEEDYENLVRIVEAEATDLDVKAKILVANVVINRVFSKDFPNTVTEVIFQGDGEQFQPIQDGRFYSVELTESSYEAVDRALVGEDYSEGALFFATVASSGEGSWFATHLNRMFEYEGHVFFGYR